MTHSHFKVACIANYSLTTPYSNTMFPLYSTRSATEHSDVIQGVPCKFFLNLQNSLCGVGTCSTQRSIQLNADEIQHYKGFFKDSLITYAQLHCDKESIGEGMCLRFYSLYMYIP